MKTLKKMLAISLAAMILLCTALSANALTACSDCGRIFENSSAYASHIKICNAGAATDAISFICSYCGAVYQTKDMFRSHVDSCVLKPAIPQKGNTNTCEDCTQDFSDENEYNNHIQLCRKTYPCSRCTKEFKTNAVLIAHQLICSILPEVVTEVKIANNPGSVELKYGDSIKLAAEARNLPAGTSIKWYIDGDAVEIAPSADGKTCVVKAVDDGTVTVMVRVVDADGNPIKDVTYKEVYDSQVIVAKSNFFLKIISFFKDLFKAERTTTQVIF